jgi:hypothetical protein
VILRYFKGEPSSHVIRYRNGQVVAHWPGLAFDHQGPAAHRNLANG